MDDKSDDDKSKPQGKGKEILSDKDDTLTGRTYRVMQAQSHATGSSPIEIKQAQADLKHGVVHARRSPDGLLLDSEGEPVPLDRIIKTANTMSSMLMAHKIALEDDFRLEPGMDITDTLINLSPIIGSSPAKGSLEGTSEPSLQSRVKDIVHEAYWDLFKEELATQTEDCDEKKYDVSKQLLADIKRKIIDLLLPQHTRLRQDVEDKLDQKVIDQLSRVHSLNLIEYAKYVLSVLSKLCAPVRDEKLKELAETTDIVSLYRGIMELLELMRLDFANFTLNRFKPHIKAHSQEYEREKFNEILKQQQSIGIDGLEFTKVWLSRAVDRIDSIHGISDMINETKHVDSDHGELNSEIMTSGSEPDAKVSKTDIILSCDIVTKVLNSAYCELLEWQPNLQKLYPETILFDEATFNQLGEQYKTLVLTSSILLTTFAFVSRFKLHDNDEFRVLAKSHVIILLTASYDNDNQQSSSKTISSRGEIEQVKLETIATKLCNDIRQKLEETNPSLIESLEKQSNLFTKQILDIQNPSNRVRELSRRRILEFVETLLTLDIEHQKKKLPPKMAPPVSIPLGLNCLADEITLTMAQLVKIIRYNRKVFFQHYQDIIVKLVLEKLEKV